MRHSACVIAACSVFLLTAGCEPPGQPRDEESQAENRGNTSSFKTLFAENCAGCHGDAGKNGPARILNDAIYLSVLPKDTLRQILLNGRPAYGMPAWALKQGGPLNDKQIDVLVNGMYAWAAPKTLTDAPRYASTTAGDAVHGKKLFGRNCFACHAKGGLSGPITEPSYLHLVSDQMLRTSIIVGRADLGMPDYRMLNAGHALADQDITDVVAYIVSLRPPGGNVQRPVEGGNGQHSEMSTGSSQGGVK